MSEYMKCPRCDLNYIKKEDGYCDVCKAELKIGPKLLFANDEDDEIDEEATELCPICKQNYIHMNEDMCQSCREELENRREDDLDMDKDEGWREFLDEDKDDDEDLGGVVFDEDEEDDSLDANSYTGEKTTATKKSDEPDDFNLGPIDESEFSEDAPLDDDEDEEDEDEDEE